MNSIIDFIQAEVKPSSLKTLTALAAAIKTSRTTFYDFVNGKNIPENTKLDLIKKIINALNLSAAKEVEFINIVSDKIKNPYQDKIISMILTPPPFEDGRKAVDVECFSDDTELNRKVRTYNDIVEQMQIKSGVTIKIKIRNCISDSALTSLFALITRLHYSIKCLDNVNVVIEHILTIGHISSVGQIEALLKVAYLIQFSNYSLYHLKYKGMINATDKTENENNIFDFLENTIAIRVTRDETGEENKYYVFHISNIEGKRDYCFESKQSYFYAFYHAMFNRLKAEIPAGNTFTTAGGATQNERLAREAGGRTGKRLIIKLESCFR